MALTLTALFEKRNDSTLRNRVGAQGWKHAKTILAQPSPIASDLKWAAKMLNDDGSGGTASQLFRAVIVLIDDGPSADSDIATAVSQAVGKLAGLET